jgi:hypothetical protein
MPDREVGIMESDLRRLYAKLNAHEAYRNWFKSQDSGAVTRFSDL